MNISGLEVESMLLRHPDIREAAVVAVPDSRLIEKVCAHVVLRNPGEGLNLEQLHVFLLQQEIMKQKFPERLEVADCLPKTPSGKARKNLLREDAALKVKHEMLKD